MSVFLRALALCTALIVAFLAFTEAGSANVADLIGGLALGLAFYFASTFAP